MVAQNQRARVSKILKIMKDVEKSSLSVNQYFKEKDTPFGRVQYYNYKRVIEEEGVDGLYDERSKGNHQTFSNEMKDYVEGLLENNKSMTTFEIQSSVEKRYSISLSSSTIRKFRAAKGLTWVRPERDEEPLDESGASEIMIALAFYTGLIDSITDLVWQCVQKKKRSKAIKDSFSNRKDLPSLRSAGKFTSDYNYSPRVRNSRFKPLEEKIENKNFSSMSIFLFSRETIMRYMLAIYCLPLVTSNGRVRSVNAPSGNALQYLCGFNYKAATLDKHLRELKYLQVSNELIDSTAKFWIDFWSTRNESDDIFACYYIDGNTKALWSSKPCLKGKVTMLGRVMNCLEQVFIHDGQGHPIYFQTFNGHTDVGKNALKMIDRITKYLEDTTTLGNQFAVNRIMIMDGAGNGVKTLREITKSDYYFISMLDSNQMDDRKVKLIAGKKRYCYGDAHLIDCILELEDTIEKGYIFEIRAVQVHWDNGRMSVLITNLPKDIFSTDNVVKSYFDRWPMQELNFKDMKGAVNIHRIVGYGKKEIDNDNVLEKIRQLKSQIGNLEKKLKKPLIEIEDLEEELLSLMKKEKRFIKKSVVVNGKRKLSASDTKRLKDIQREINKTKRTIKNIEKDNEKPFRSLKKKKTELSRIIDKKKIYHVDVELDQIMTCFKISFVNICCYLLEECFNGEKMTLNRMLEDLFALNGKVKIDEEKRTIFIERNLKQEDFMEDVELALNIINDLNIQDMNGYTYNFELV